VVITDLNGIVGYVNPRFVAATGYSSAAAVGQDFRDLRGGSVGAGIE
jgi:PAS domain S-box-containing protein